MRRWLMMLPVLGLVACGREVPTKAFEKVKTRVCACKDAACAEALVADVKHLRTLGSEPEDAALAKAELDQALACATKIAPDITRKLDEAF